MAEFKGIYRAQNVRQHQVMRLPCQLSHASSSLPSESAPPTAGGLQQAHGNKCWPASHLQVPGTSAVA